MGICDTNKKEELFIGYKPVPMEIANKLSKSICKITYINMNNQKIYGTGFFMIYNSLKCLISVNHVITSNLINKNIEIEIYNKKKINIELNSRYIKFYKRPIDISVIEIKEKDGIDKEIEYLNHDINYKVIGYSKYKEMEVISLGYPFGEELSAGIGKIIDIKGYEFEHNIPTEQGSSGAPIILLNLKMVIGIHKYGDLKKNINVGTFIGEIYNENNIKNIDKEEDKILNENNIKKEKVIDERYILNLSFKNLGDEGIQNLINYKDIIVLDLSINNISDIKVLEKVKFNKLEILNLSENKISNNINILENVNFKELKELYLHDIYKNDIKILKKYKFNIY